jgi:hypothetical protein
LAFCVFLVGCYERKDASVINPDGSGKMFVEILVAVPAQGLPGKDKPTALTFGRQVTANLINSTRGVDAWADLAITQNGDGRARIAATAYFPDLNALKFDMPLVFVWKRDPELGPVSAGRSGGPAGGGGGATFSIERTRTSVAKPYTQITDAELKDMVTKAQAQYKETQLALQTQLNAFRLDMSFQLPGDVTATHLLAREDNTVSLLLDGKKAMEALDKFMADEAALRATFKAGEDIPENDDLMLVSMYGQKGPVSAHVKFAAGAPPVFDYRTESSVAQLRQADMLQNAGVELLPKFIVRPATQPASQPVSPASRPVTGGR